LSGIKKTSSDDWIQRANNESHLVSGMKKTNTFSALQETGKPASKSEQAPIPSGRRGVRTVPFSRETFEQITNGFHIHGSIARVVSRTDVPVFTCDKVIMTESSYGRVSSLIVIERWTNLAIPVYNCRSSNAWGMDLALTVTHFPKSRLTFAILFGCPFSIEKEIIMRLANLKAEVAHPLLMPGIFAEIEQRRHTDLVVEMGDKLETLIFQLDHQSNDFEGPQGALAAANSKEQRTAYLDLSYLRNSLVSWNTQLAKMVQHCRQLNKEQYSSKIVGNSILHQNVDLRVGRTIDRVASRSSNISRSLSIDERYKVDASKESESLINKEWAQLEETTYSKNPENLNKYIGRPGDEGIELAHTQITSHQSTITNEVTGQPVIQPWAMSRNTDEREDFQEKLRDTSYRIESRLMSIRDEYDDKIRDCTMRVDGMAMSTQWVRFHSKLLQKSQY
jgi:hypothetical protein